MRILKPAFLTILLALAHSTPADDDFYGMHVGNDTDIGQSIPVLRDLGVRWVRLWTNVTWTEKRSWSVFRSAKMYHDAGFKVILLLAHDKGPGQPMPTPQQAKEYFEWVLTEPGLKDAVDIWEIANELNLEKYWPGTAKEYVDRLLKPAWEVFHPAGEKVLGGSNTAWQADDQGKYGYKVDHCKRLKAAGYLDYCDYAGTHPYTEHLNEMLRHLRQVKEVYGDKPLIATEWNFKQEGNFQSWARDLDEARDSLESVLYIACHYRLIGFSSEGGWPGVIDYDFKPVQPFYDLYQKWPKNSLPLPKDTQAPSRPLNLKASALDAERVQLDWEEPTDNVGVAGYSIYFDGDYAGMVTENTYIKGGLKPAREYAVQVMAFDLAGNTSPVSEKVVAKTAGGYKEGPVADAYVFEREPEKNYGEVHTNLVKGVDGWERHTYMRFDLKKGGFTNVGSATLSLRVVSLGSENLQPVRLKVHPVEDDTWEESTLTWKGRPSLGNAVAEIAVELEGETHVFNVTDFVRSEWQGNKLVSFCIVDAAKANRSIGIASRESGSSRPMLEISENAAVGLQPAKATHAAGHYPESLPANWNGYRIDGRRVSPSLPYLPVEGAHP